MRATETADLRLLCASKSIKSSRFKNRTGLCIRPLTYNDDHVERSRRSSSTEMTPYFSSYADCPQKQQTVAGDEGARMGGGSGVRKEEGRTKGYSRAIQ